MAAETDKPQGAPQQGSKQWREYNYDPPQPEHICGDCSQEGFIQQA